MLETFVGPRPEGMECCHNDGNTSNNSIENLRWGTPKENSEDRKRHGTYLCGENVGGAKLKENEVQEVRQLIASVMSDKRIAKKFSVSSSCIQGIRDGKTWKHLAAVVELIRGSDGQDASETGKPVAREVASVPAGAGMDSGESG
jgi:hypothetical protein